MVFSSLIFLYLFLPVTLGGYFIMPRAARNGWLLMMSILFYAWGEGWYALVMVATIVFNYGMGRWLAGTAPGARRRTLLLAVAVNLGALLAFKYSAFMAENLAPILMWCGVRLPAFAPPHLPIGISFFTFQAISYVVDVAAGRIPAQANIIEYGMYKAFFPQLIAGPIVRYCDVAAEVAARRESSSEMAAGIERFLIGLAKKVLIANVLAEPADSVFALPSNELTGTLAWLGIASYGLQIYFDFSAYSDMAIGMARMFGFHFKENFDYPYAAVSMRDFWRRWHISLSSWFRDYLYFPLGGSRVGGARTSANLLVVFAACGLWHGAGWNFLVWGLYHGMFLTVEHWWGERFARWWAPLRHVYVIATVAVGWVFFRADSLTQACDYLQALSGLGVAGPSDVLSETIVNPEILLCLLLGVLGSAGAGPRLYARLAGRCAEGSPRAWCWEASRCAGLALLMWLCTMKLAASTYNPFIYFRF